MEEIQLKDKKLNYKEGWLIKRGNVRKNWKRRFFSLSAVDNCIYYSKTPKDRFLGKIVLKGAYLQKDPANNSSKSVFYINTTSGRYGKCVGIK